MKLLFIENRGKTAFWQQVALELQSRGHQVAWIVQNPQYLPDAFEGKSPVHLLSFPPAAMRTQPVQTESWVRQNHPMLLTDRGRTYFNAGTAHYDHYTKEIGRVLRTEQPDLVVGESTLVHELIAIGLCRDAGIAYVHPCANRYPDGRFSIFKSETQHIASGSGESWPDSMARELAERIATGREIPFYMQKPSRLHRITRRLRQMSALALVWWGHLRGERYNTPGLYRKFTLQLQLRKNLRAWNSLQKMPASVARALLYPFQMQPEANIDVWGRPYSDQVAMVRAMLAASPPDVQVAIKANPKSKYEVTAELIALACADRRVCLLPLTMTMAQAQACTAGTLTVSGTVGFEAVFGKGRCMSLRHPIIEKEFPSLHADSVEEGVRRLLADPQAGRGGADLGTKLVQCLVAQSFLGLVSEPQSHPHCLDPQNIRLVADALHGLVK
jgi:hypothetical protein